MRKTVVPQCDHLPPLASHDKCGSVRAEPRGKHSIECRRGATTLDVAQDGGTNFTGKIPFDLFGDIVAHPSETNRVRACLHGFADDQFAADGLGSLRGGNDRVFLSRLLPAFADSDDFVDIKLNFRNQDDV